LRSKSYDILNVEGTAAPSKRHGNAPRRKKLTYPALYGLESSKEKARTLPGRPCGGSTLRDERTAARPRRYIVERKQLTAIEKVLIRLLRVHHK
jgi:geranylgeranyl pyrophosphate synthase